MLILSFFFFKLANVLEIDLSLVKVCVYNASVELYMESSLSCNMILYSSGLLCVCVFLQNAVSMYCRLGFAHKKGQVINLDNLHPSWKNVPSVNRLK